MKNCVFNIPQRDEIVFSVEDGYIVLTQTDQLGEEPATLRIHHLDAEWLIAGLKAAVESAQSTD